MAVLRDELGYDGVVFSDDLEMKAVADHYTPEELVAGSLAAGVDSLLVCRTADLREEVLAALETTPRSQLTLSLERMARFKAVYAGDRAGNQAGTAGPPYAEHAALAGRPGSNLT
jgi:beta-N-acetylhexosaminidase